MKPDKKSKVIEFTDDEESYLWDMYENIQETKEVLRFLLEFKRFAERYNITDVELEIRMAMMSLIKILKKVDKGFLKEIDNKGVE